MKENAEGIVKNLDSIYHQTEQLLQNGLAMMKQMKLKKIQDIKQIDETFERIVKQVQFKKAKLKKEY